MQKRNLIIGCGPVHVASHAHVNLLTKRSLHPAENWFSVCCVPDFQPDFCGSFCEKSADFYLARNNFERFDLIYAEGIGGMNQHEYLIINQILSDKGFLLPGLCLFSMK